MRRRKSPCCDVNIKIRPTSSPCPSTSSGIPPSARRWSADHLERPRAIIRHHHENSTSRLPTGWRGHLSADRGHRESFDAIPRATAPLDFDNALDELKRGAGTRYDPKLVEIFASQIRELEHR
jgi:hypothetical protein